MTDLPDPAAWLVIRHRNERGAVRAEVLTFRDGLVVEGRGLELEFI